MIHASRSVDHHIAELRHGLLRAALNYEIWWAYKEKNSRQKYAGTMNQYSPFFQTGIHAHFVAYVMAMYGLYEKRKDTVNIPRLIETIKKSGKLSQADVAETEKLYRELKPIWVKVGILRNNVFGHCSEHVGAAAAFKQANTTPNELKRFIESTGQLLNIVSMAWDKTGYILNTGSGAAALRLLEDLRRYNHRTLTTRSTGRAKAAHR